MEEMQEQWTGLQTRTEAQGLRLTHTLLSKSEGTYLLDVYAGQPCPHVNFQRSQCPTLKTKQASRSRDSAQTLIPVCRANGHAPWREHRVELTANLSESPILPFMSKAALQTGLKTS